MEQHFVCVISEICDFDGLDETTAGQIHRHRHRQGGR